MKLFFNGDIAADDAFQASVLRSQQQCAVRVERLRCAADLAVADMNLNTPAQGGAMLLPLVRD